MTRVDPTQTRPAIRVAVAAPVPEMLRLHEDTAEYADELEVCAMISSADAVISQSQLLQPDVLVLSAELDTDRSDWLAQLSTVSPATRIVMLVTAGTGAEPVIADATVRIGAPVSELRAAIVGVAGRGPAALAPAAHSRTDPARSSPVATDAARLSIAPRRPPETAPAARPEPEPEKPAEAAQAPVPAAGRLVLAFAGKGGVGTSVVAVNLATLLALRGASVALVDLSLQFGDVGALLHLEGHPLSIDALAQQGPEVDAAALDDALATSAEGVRVLLAPATPEASDMVGPATVAAVLGRLTQAFEFVVVDSPSHLDERIVGVVEAADQVLLVSSSGVTSVKDTKVTLRLLQALAIEPDRVALVVNHSTSHITFPVEEIERALRFPILATLPHEPRMDDTVENGRPHVVAEPRSGFTRQMQLVADHVARAQVPRTDPEQRRHGAGWRLRFGR